LRRSSSSSWIFDIFSDCDDGEAAEVGIDDNGLCICVADNAYAGIAFKFIKLSFKLGSEICTFQIVNGANKNKENNMGGFFGTVSKSSCVTDLFYGTDYNSHLGTKRGGLATYSQEKEFSLRSTSKFY